MSLDQLSPDNAAFAAQIATAPKIELHVHMEAAVPESFYAELNARSQIFALENLPSRRKPFAHLKDFIAAWVDQTRLIEDPLLFEEMTKAFVADRMAQKIVYSEVHISPIDFSLVRKRFNVPAKVLKFEDCLRAYLRGLKAALATQSQVEVRVIVDTLWISTDEECREMLAALKSCYISGDAFDTQGEPLIVAIGMGGPEVVSHGPGKRWFIDACRELGLKVDIHSGENTSSADHRTALECIRPDRVGHGISGALDSRPFFFEGPIVTCPMSNVLTGSFKGVYAQHPLENHPITMMRQRGGLTSIGTDDPLLFGVSLVQEWCHLREALGWSFADFEDLNEQAARSCLAPKVLKRVFQNGL